MTTEIKALENLFSQTISKLNSLEIQLLKQNQISDLTINEIHIIQNIGTNLKKTMSEISRNLEITPGALTPSVDRLVKKGYVSRRHSETDRRIVIVELTSRGELVFKLFNSIHSEITQQILSFLTIEEGIILTKTMEKFNQYLDRRISAETPPREP